MVKPGAVVIDVGMNRNDEGKLCGDVDFDGVKASCGLHHPVPGGVGPMTITMLLVNTMEAAEREAAANERLLNPPSAPIAPLHPLFDQIRAEHVEPAIDLLLAQAQAALDTVTSAEFPAEWNAIARCWTSPPSAWDVPGASPPPQQRGRHPELRAAYNAAPARVTDFWTRLGSDERLYAKYKAIDPANKLNAPNSAAGQPWRALSAGGAELQVLQKERFAALQEQQAELGQRFSEHALDATDAFAYYANAEEMAGAPGCAAGRAQARAQADGQKGQAQSQDALLPAGHAVCAPPPFARTPVPRLRNPASDQAEGDAQQWDNTATMQSIPALRQEKPTLWDTRITATSPGPQDGHLRPMPVIAFLRDLAHKARPLPSRMADMRGFAAEHLDLHRPAGLGLGLYR